MAKTKGLTHKQVNFTEAYIRLGNATEAYLEAYNTTNRASARCQGHLILHKPEVQELINKSRAKKLDAVEKRLDRAAISVDTIVAEQERAMEMAQLSGNSVAFAAASMNKAKLLGLLIERQAVMTATVNMNELAPDLAKIWGRAKLVLPRAVTPDKPALEIASDCKDIEE